MVIKVKVKCYQDTQQLHKTIIKHLFGNGSDSIQ